MAQLSRVTKKILAQLSSVLFHRKLLISNLAQLSRELNYPEAQLSRVDCTFKFFFKKMFSPLILDNSIGNVVAVYIGQFG